MTLRFKHSACELLILLVLFPLCLFIDWICYFSTARNSRDKEFVPVLVMRLYGEADV